MKGHKKQYRHHILAALPALALLLLLAFAGCAAVPAAAPAQPGQTETASPTPSADAFLVDALPEGVWLRVWTMNGSVFVRADGRTSGGPYPSSRWLLDQAGREDPVRVETEKGENFYRGRQETLFTLYAIDGTLLLECGRMSPSVLLGSLVFLNDVWGGAAPFAYDLAAGEAVWKGYSYAGQPAEGVYLLSGRNGNPPLLLNEQLREVRRFDGYDSASVCQIWQEDLPGYIELSRKGSSETVLYSLARDEILPGGFVQTVDAGQPAGLFSTPAGWVIRDLASGKPLNEPAGGEFQRVYSVYTPQVKIYTLDLAPGAIHGEGSADEASHEEGAPEEGPIPFCGTDDVPPDIVWYYLEYPGGLVRCVEVGPAPNGWYAQRPDGSVLIVGRKGELLGALEAQNGSLARLLPGRYEFYGTENSTGLLDADDGGPLAGLDWIRPSGVPGIWSVREGRQCGLMNETGQWLWKLPLKTTLHFNWASHRGPAEAS